MQDLVIIGAGAFGEDMLDNIRWINEEELRWNLLGFIDEIRTGDVDGVKILGKLEDFLKMDRSVQYFVADMDGKVRERIMTRCKEAGFKGATIIGITQITEGTHTIGENVYLGHSSLLLDGVVIGDSVILEHRNVVSRQAVIGAFSTLRIMTSLSAAAKLGRYNSLGLCCVVDDGVSTVDNCSFSAGSVVLQNATEAACYEGIPAKQIRQ